MDISKYDNIARLGIEFDVNRIKQHIPTPQKSDYLTGYIIRFFTRRTNDKNSVIYEIDESVYTALESNPLYVTTSLDWRITGTDEAIRNSNAASIRLASKNISNLGLYLPYLLQFKKTI